MASVTQYIQHHYFVRCTDCQFASGCNPRCWLPPLKLFMPWDWVTWGTDIPWLFYTSSPVHQDGPVSQGVQITICPMEHSSSRGLWSHWPFVRHQRPYIVTMCDPMYAKAPPSGCINCMLWCFSQLLIFVFDFSIHDIIPFSLLFATTESMLEMGSFTNWLKKQINKSVDLLRFLIPYLRSLYCPAGGFLKSFVKGIWRCICLFIEHWKLSGGGAVCSAIVQLKIEQANTDFLAFVVLKYWPTECEKKIK